MEYQSDSGIIILNSPLHSDHTEPPADSSFEPVCQHELGRAEVELTRAPYCSVQMIVESKKDRCKLAGTDLVSAGTKHSEIFRWLTVSTSQTSYYSYSHHKT